MYSFPVDEQEEIRKKGHASLHMDGNAWTGAFYLTSDRLVFIGYMIDISRKYIEEIPLSHIAELRAGKTFLVIPNVLDIVTIGGRRVRLIVSGQTAWLAAIRAEMDRVGLIR